MKSAQRILSSILVTLLMAASVACAGGSQPEITTPPAIRISVSPAAVTIPAGTSQQFTATVSNTTNHAVTWQVNGVTGGDANVGTVSSVGVYTAPLLTPAPPSVVVTAISQADTSKSGSATVTIPPIDVFVFPQGPVVEVNTTLQFGASVNNHPNQAVAWQVNGIAGGNATVGTISAAGLYTAPASVADATSITVTAISQQDTSRSGSAAASIVPVITVSVTPAVVELSAADQQHFSAIVTGVSNHAVTWTTPLYEYCYWYCDYYTDLRDGSVDSSGLYTAPSYPPSDSGSVVITASSVVNPAKSDTGEVKVVFSDASLSGRYSFYFRGRKPGGGEKLAAGVFSADGHGTLSSGVQDVNDSAAGVSANVAFTGTYSIGADGRGSATFTTAAGSTEFRFLLVQGNNLDNATLGLMMEYDGAAAAEGALMRVGAPVLEGNRVFGAEGFGASGKTAVAGQFTASQGGSISSGLEDVNNAGVVSSQVTFTGTATTAVNERGTLNLTSTLGTSHFSFYPVDLSSNKLILMGLDANPALLGFAYPQSGLPSIATLAGEFVFSRSGVTNGQPFVSAGRFTANGAGSISNGVSDENLNGTAAENGALTGTYSVAASGRGTATFTSNQVTSHFAFYQSPSDLVAFFVQTDTESVTAGRFDPQRWGGFDGSSIAGRDGLLLSVSEIGGGPASHLALLQMSSGNITGIEDVNAVSGQTTGVSVTGTYSVQSNGRGSLVLSTPTGDFASRFYVSEPGIARMVGLDANRLVSGVLVRRF